MQSNPFTKGDLVTPGHGNTVWCVVDTHGAFLTLVEITGKREGRVARRIAFTEVFRARSA